MSKAIIGDQLWAEMTEGQKIDAVLKGHATLLQMSEGLLDGSEKLRRACEDCLAHTDPSFENLPVVTGSDTTSETPSAVQNLVWRPRIIKPARRNRAPANRPRFGLPEGFVPRLQRFGRGVLLEKNFYRLPNGQEFIPVAPAGTLGTRQHLYALLTGEQYLKGKRGSVYLRNDGRIFDYSRDGADSSSDFFDTGFTIYDLERTGRYAPAPSRKRRKKAPPKARRAQAGSTGRI